MLNADKLRVTAQDLKKGKYWGTFSVEALMGWICLRGTCVYCDAELVEPNHMINGLATTDHLLSRKGYPELDFADLKLEFRDYLNAVPTCQGCNCLKGSWDPNTQGGPQLYFRGVQARLTCEMQRELIARSREYIIDQREQRRDTNARDRQNWREVLGRME